jgi:hypothetical protein
MTLKEPTKFFWDSESKMIVMKIRRSPCKKIIHPKIRLRFSTRITETRFTSECYFFDMGASIASKSSES